MQPAGAQPADRQPDAAGGCILPVVSLDTSDARGRPNCRSSPPTGVPPIPASSAPRWPCSPGAGAHDGGALYDLTRFAFPLGGGDRENASARNLSSNTPYANEAMT